MKKFLQSTLALQALQSVMFSPRSAMSRVPSKISSIFAARLGVGRSMAPEGVQLLLSPSGLPAVGNFRPPARSRRNTDAAINEAALTAIPLADAILEKHRGRCHHGTPDAFGFVSVEVSPSEILELAEQTWIRAIMEDQRVVCAG